jgi:hypothetical protein
VCVGCVAAPCYVRLTFAALPGQMYLFVIMMTYSVLGVYLWKDVYANQDDEDCDGAFNDPFAAWLSLMGARAPWSRLSLVQWARILALTLARG